MDQKAPFYVDTEVFNDLLNKHIPEIRAKGPFPFVMMRIVKSDQTLNKWKIFVPILVHGMDGRYHRILFTTTHAPRSRGQSVPGEWEPVFGIAKNGWPVRLSLDELAKVDMHGNAVPYGSKILGDVKTWLEERVDLKKVEELNEDAEKRYNDMLKFCETKFNLKGCSKWQDVPRDKRDVLQQIFGNVWGQVFEIYEWKTGFDLLADYANGEYANTIDDWNDYPMICMRIDDMVSLLEKGKSDGYSIKDPRNIRNNAGYKSLFDSFTEDMGGKIKLLSKDNQVMYQDIINYLDNKILPEWREGNNDKGVCMNTTRLVYKYKRGETDFLNKIPYVLTRSLIALFGNAMKAVWDEYAKNDPDKKKEKRLLMMMDYVGGSDTPAYYFLKNIRKYM